MIARFCRCCHRCLLLCKNFNVAHYSKSIKGIKIKLGILAHHDKMQLQGKGHNSVSYINGVMPLFNLAMVPDRQALVPHAV